VFTNNNFQSYHLLCTPARNDTAFAISHLLKSDKNGSITYSNVLHMESTPPPPPLLKRPRIIRSIIGHLSSFIIVDIKNPANTYSTVNEKTRETQRSQGETYRAQYFPETLSDGGKYIYTGIFTTDIVSILQCLKNKISYVHFLVNTIFCQLNWPLTSLRW
jgi:hypothetical protein